MAQKSSVVLKLPTRGTPKNLRAFAEQLKRIQRKMKFKISSRGWCYQLEGFKIIHKGEFDKVQNWINKCRKAGYLPIDFVAEEKRRSLQGVHYPDRQDPIQQLKNHLEYALEVEKYHDPEVWNHEKYYLAVVVEKVDLISLFKPICNRYKIPYCNTVGSSSILQRAHIAWEFQRHEENGLQPVILYCGDLDPYGMLISDSLKKNFFDIAPGTGWVPFDLKIDRIGLNFEQVESMGLTWIDNLISGSGKNMADLSQYKSDAVKTIVTDYIRKYGARKCEANALVVQPKAARQLLEDKILSYLGDDVLDRRAKIKADAVAPMQKFREETKIDEILKNAIDLIDQSK